MSQKLKVVILALVSRFGRTVAIACALVALPALAAAQAQAETWTPTQFMHTASARSGSTSASLPDGRVLVAGGTGDGHGDPTTSAEIYNPATNSWSVAPEMSTRRAFGAVTVLNDGRVLMTGGKSSGNGVDLEEAGSSEIYDSTSNSWSAPVAMLAGRIGHSATLLLDGRVLVVAGCNDIYESALWSVSCFADAEIYNPLTNAWTSAASLAVPRAGHTATRLPGGRVLVAGGKSYGSYVADAEVYDPSANTWTQVAALDVSRYGHTASLLPDGRVLVVGGMSDGGTWLTTTEIFDPRFNAWSYGPSLHRGRFGATATTLPDNRIVIAGGDWIDMPVGQTDCWTPIPCLPAPAEIFDPLTAGGWTETVAMQLSRVSASASLLPNGQILVTGGGSGGWRGDGAPVEEVFGAPSLLRIAEPVITASFGGTATVAATLYVNGSSAPGKSIDFSLQGSIVGSSVTDEHGVATFDISVAGVELGTYRGAMAASFHGDAQIPATVGTTDLEVDVVTPAVVWNPPPPIVIAVDAVVGPSQLNALIDWNATASVPGSWQTSFTDILYQACVTFTPSDLVHYVPVTQCHDIFVSLASSQSLPTIEATLDLGFDPHIGAPPVWWARQVGAVPDAVHNLVYASDAHDGTIAVIDGTTDEIIDHIVLQEGPTTGWAMWIAVDPGRERLYASDLRQPIMWTIDTATRSVLSATTTAYRPDDLFAVNPTTGLLYLGGGNEAARRYLTGDSQAPGGDTIIVIDPTDMTQPVATVDAPGWRGQNDEGPFERIAIDSVTNLVYIGTSNGVKVIGGDPADPASFNQVVMTLWSEEMELAPQVTVNPRTQLLYVAPLWFRTPTPGDGDPSQSQTIKVYDANPRRATYGQLAASISLDNSLAFVPAFVEIPDNYYGTSYFEDLKVAGIAINPTTNMVYVRYRGKQPDPNYYWWERRGEHRSALVAIDGSTNAVASVTMLRATDPSGVAGDSLGRIAVNPSTGRIYVTDGNTTTSLTVLRDRPPVVAATSSTTGPVTIQVPQASISFASVASGGTTTITQVDAAQFGLQVPSQFSVTGALAYEISTTATVGTPIQLCFNASFVDDQATFNALVVLHGEQGAWVNRTSSRDFPSRTICATVSSLSPFAIARRLGPSDTTAPVSSATSSSASTWTPTNVVVTFTAADNPGGAGVKQINVSFSGAQTGSTVLFDASGSAVVSVEGETTVAFFATDNAGNVEATKTLVVRIDRTAPRVQCASADTIWRASDVALACTTSDAGSGLINAADASFTLTTAVPAGVETANAMTTSRVVCDAAGNCVTAGPAAGLRIDKRAPTVTIVAPASTSYVLNQSVAANYTCADGGSGVGSCQGPVLSGALIVTKAVGLQTFSVSGRDAVGNAATNAVNYTVAYGVSVLYDQTKAVKSGSTVPIKLQLVDAAGKNVSASSTVVTATVVSLVGSTTATGTDDSGNANPDSNFRYDATLGGYIFNLSTKGLAVGAYQLSFTVVGDPNTHAVQFQVGK